MLKQVARALQLAPAVPLHKVLQVRGPDVAHMRELEQRHAALVHLERLLPELVLLQEGGVVEDDLRRGDAQLQHAVVHGLRRLQRAQALLQVGVEGPELEGAVQPRLHRQRALLLHRHAARPVRGLRGGAPHEVQRAPVVLVAQLHLGPLAPHLRQVIHVLVLDTDSLLKDDARVGHVAVALVELGKRAPQAVRLAQRLVNVHRLDRLCVREDLLGGVALKQLDALVPLRHVVRVLAQHHAGQQLGAARHEVLEPRQPQVNVVAVVLEQKVAPVTLLLLSRLVFVVAQRLHLGGEQRLLKLGERVKDEREVVHGDDAGHALLVHVARLLKHATPDVVVGQ
mmetsp:Transcript_10728/g.26437  ORF Transcript_10728/g.26437 Transcript_10728/m.26437 type:complete len:340 (-) Transcript_10728:841-1860(-)